MPDQEGAGRLTIRSRDRGHAKVLCRFSCEAMSDDRRSPSRVTHAKLRNGHLYITSHDGCHRTVRRCGRNMIVCVDNRSLPGQEDLPALEGSGVLGRT